MRAFLNPAVRRDIGYRGRFPDEAYRDVDQFYSAHPELRPTPLVMLPGLSAAAGIGMLSVKDETARFGLNAFKIVGVRYAVTRLGTQTIRRGVVCATAGNHGRAVARVAREVGVACTVFVPAANTSATAGASPSADTRDARVQAMREDGAHVVDVAGSYEDAVARASEFGVSTGATIVSDTSWPGYDQIPAWIMAGYTRLFEEAARQWSAVPDVVIVQGGVGGLVCAAANWFAWRYGPNRPFLIACEPDGAACLQESSRSGAPVRLAATDTIMAGLRCAEPSPVAWPAIRDGVDALVSIPDAQTVEAMRVLSQPVEGDGALASGPSGACGVGTLLAIAADGASASAVRSAARWGRSTRVMAVVTEGP
ncbi:MAG: pyridoxal-phosphate dependent enzyme [Acidobacteria bacterium]|nr:pyridoxal-phosphate dependent enzyme [Acidobacteriota bacterium]MCA1651481.1 pyridoxal-phosphate dependent enzyme [Acidobacteriota bacterium]